MLEITPKFKYALERMDQLDDSILFITGKAGSGKSTLLSHYCLNSDTRPVLLAPTGVSALNINGETIHRFFNFYIDIQPQQIINLEVKPRKPKLFKKLKTIIIDEISMVRADLLDCVDLFLRMYGPKPGCPFGGVKMIFVGDLYQLPPIVGSSEKKVFNELYKTPFFFSAKVFADIELEMIELDKIFRQSDGQFISLLNQIRNNSIEQDGVDSLNKCYQPSYTPPEESFCIHLTTTNKDSDIINQTQIDKLTGETYHFEAEVTGQFEKEYYPTLLNLQLMTGAQIMFLNNDSNERWVNGTIGTIESIRKVKDETRLFIKLQDSARVVVVEKYLWEIIRFEEKDDELVPVSSGTFRQFPVKLAWAVTIHKSQGKTFDNVIIDFGKGTFASGQAYVALSRCRKLDGIVLTKPFKKNHIRVDYRIFKFLTHLQYLAALKRLPTDKKMDILKKSIEDKQSVQITYLKANDTKSVRTITPTQVGEEVFKGKTFPALRAYCSTRRQERVFHVGRIIEIEAL